MIIHLKVRWIDKKDIVKLIYKKGINAFLNHVNLPDETLMLKLIYLIIEQKLN